MPAILLAQGNYADPVDEVYSMAHGEPRLKASITLLQNPFVKKSDKLDQLIQEELSDVQHIPEAKTRLCIALTSRLIDMNDFTGAKSQLILVESALDKIKGNSLGALKTEMAILRIRFGNVEKARADLHNLQVKARNGADLYVAIQTLLLRADAFALLKDDAGINEALNSADELADDLSMDVDEKETSHILCQLIINLIRLGKNTNLDKYYNQLLQTEKNNGQAEYVQAIAMYQDYRNQNVKAERNYKVLVKPYLKGNRSVSGFEALIRLAALYSKVLNVDSASHYFNLAKKDLNPLLLNQPAGILYGQLYRAHLLRFDRNRNLVTEVSKMVLQRDSEYKLELTSALKELGYKYSLLSSKQKIKLLEQQKQLAALKALKARQRNWLLVLSLILLVLGAFTLSYVFYQKRKRSLLQYEAEKKQTEYEYNIAMNNMLAESQEEERSRIAEKLHDEIGSMLAVIRLNLSSANDDGTVILPNGQIKTASKILADVADTVRAMSHELMPIALNKLGLKQAIEQLIWDINTSGKIYIESVIMGLEKEEDIFSYDFKVNIYRVIQELFQNILKHAQASHVLFQLLIRQGDLNLMVEDNGVGIPETKDASSGKGIKLIKARLNAYRGKMVIDSKHGAYTLVIIDVPLESIQVKS